MSQHMYRNIFLIILAGYLSMSAWLTTAASDSYSLIWAFDCDEAGVLEDLINMFRAHSYAPLNYIYGTLHEYLALSALLVLELFRRVTEQDGIILLRLINAFAGAGIFIILYRMSINISLPLLSIISTLMLLTTKGYILFSFNAKPELLQIFFLMLSLYFLGQAALLGQWRWYVFAGAGAGLAFTVKFTGLMLFPVALVVPFVAVCANTAKVRTRIFTGLIGCVYMIFGFIAIIAMTSPAMLKDALLIARRLGIQAAVNREGFLFFAQNNFTEWFTLLFSPSLLGTAGVIGLALFIVILFRQKLNFSRKEWAIISIHGAWSLLFCLYLMLNVNVREIRYILPATPSIVFLAGFGLLRSAEIFLKNHVPWKSFVVIIVFLMAILPGIANTTELISSCLNRMDMPRVKAGNWLMGNVPYSASIASDFDTYVPKTFVNQFRNNFLTSRDVLMQKSDYIVISKPASAMFQNISMAKSFTEGEAAFMLHYYLYHGLVSGEFPGYALIKDFDEVLIYKRVN